MMPARSRKPNTQFFKLMKLGKLSAGFLHDFANPLTVVLFGVKKLEVAIQRNQTQKEIRTLIETITLATKHMEQLLKTTHAEITENEHREEFCVREKIKNICTMLSYYMEKDHVQHQINFDENTMILIGSPCKFSQIISNLILNALESYKNIPEQENKMLHITAKKCTSNKSNSFVEITISDNGDGIPLKIKQKIFTPFFTTKSTGTGLGLSITKQIVEQNFLGTISFTSKQKVGTTFIVRIPVKNKTS